METMDFTGILTYMQAELALIAAMVIAFLYDLFAGKNLRRHFHAVVCALMALCTVAALVPFHTAPAELFGGMFVYTPAGAIVKAILCIGTLIVIMQSDLWLAREDTSFKRGEFYVLTLSTLIGMYFMISAGHFLMFFIGLELASVPMACLVAFDKYRHNSAEAGAKFILTALFSSGLMLFGISYLYGTVGTLYFDNMVAGITGSPLQILALVFFFSGLGFKLSLVPFHLWTADTYEGAPTAVTGYLSVISKGAAAFTLMAILVKALGPMVGQWQVILYILIILSITVGNLFAIRQQNLKRFLAFSSISQAGYIMLAVISGTPYGMTSLIFYVLIYMVANLAAFGVIGVIEQKSGGRVGMSDYNGLYKTNPKLAVTMTLALFSLAGIPPFAGFFSKFFIFAAAFEKGFWILVLIALLNTVISLYYYLLVVKAMFITPSDNPVPAFKSDWYTRISLIVCLAGILLIGIVSSIFDGINLFSFGL